MTNLLMRTLYVTALLGLLIGSEHSALAIPGYHISDDAAADRAVRQFAENPDQFHAAVYQATLDKTTWRLALAAHRYKEEEPKDVARQCCFADAYWQAEFESLPGAFNGPREILSNSEITKLHSYLNEAAKDTVESAKKLPKSYIAHLVYGKYVQYHLLMDSKNIKIMLSEFKSAVELRPDLGETHFALAVGYAGSNDHTLPIIDNAIGEFKSAIKHDPRLTEAYFLMAALSMQPQKMDYIRARAYLKRYLQAQPDLATRSDIVAMQKELDHPGTYPR